jgi:hydroxymethylglutaryl-coA synthase
MNIGIDKISMEVSNKYVSIEELAIKRGVEVDKFIKGIGQSEMSFTSKNQDAITLGYLAARDIVDDYDREHIDLVILATESSVDESKAGSIYIKEFLGINDYCKCIEIKQACFGATAALDFAKGHLTLNENSRVLIIASDIAKYGPNSAGEVTQGAGAIAMIVARMPKILEFNNDEVAYTKDVMDFWRPTGDIYPSVDGKFSLECYIELLNKAWQGYRQKNSKKELKAICFHVPYTKLAYKAMINLTTNEDIMKEFYNSIIFNKRVGNIYTGSLYLSLISLLVNTENLQAGDNIGMYSYGSGAVSQFFSFKLVEGYEKYINKEFFENKLNKRIKVPIDDYENIFFENQSVQENLDFYLDRIENNKRIYVLKDADKNVEK